VIVEEGLENDIGYELKRAQHALRKRLDGALRSIGLTTPQYAALSALGSSPGLSGAELARRGFVTPQTMNAIVAGLESAGLILRRPHPAHGRVLQAYLTEAGRDLLVRADREAEAVTRRMLAGLDQGERYRLLAALRSCVDSLELSGSEEARL
jgi:DNA-binding MarR family transcriptional regulator